MRPPFTVQTMRYRARSSLSYCVIDDHAIFLDIDADRYFLLPDHLERAFLDHVRKTGIPDERLQELADRKILTSVPMATRPAREHAEPSRSAAELPSQTKRPAVLHVPEVWADVWTCRRMLRTQPFRDVLDAIVQYRKVHDASARLGVCPKQQDHLLLHTSIFQRARLYVPIEPRCLMDSLALTRFLARRHHSANIVFGVTHEPFAAHCWAQTGDLVLNDTLGNARSHTPIRVV